MSVTEDLAFLAQAADPDVVGAAVLEPGRPAEAGWYVVERADGVRVRLDTATGAPPAQAARDAVAGADLSPAAVQARADARAPERTAVRALLAQAVADNDAFLAVAAPTAAQTLAQVRALTRQASAALRRLAQID
jgi:hypothetical protein